MLVQHALGLGAAKPIYHAEAGRSRSASVEVKFTPAIIWNERCNTGGYRVVAAARRGGVLSHMCYARSEMTEVASRELRNDTRGLLGRVAAGEDIVITVDGHPVAALRPLEPKPRWIAGPDFIRRLSRRQADPGLAAELRDLAPDTTDDLPL